MWGTIRTRSQLVIAAVADFQRSPSCYVRWFSTGIQLKHRPGVLGAERECIAMRRGSTAPIAYTQTGVAKLTHRAENRSARRGGRGGDQPPCAIGSGLHVGPVGAQDDAGAFAEQLNLLAPKVEITAGWGEDTARVVCYGVCIYCEASVRLRQRCACMQCNRCQRQKSGDRMKASRVEKRGDVSDNIVRQRVPRFVLHLRVL